jgi:glutamine amidotransferase-like uncharacterized protein
MNALRCIGYNPIRYVVVYKGHEQNPVLGPYLQSVGKRIEMFNCLNYYRQEQGRSPWKVTALAGEDLVEGLKAFPFKDTLLVIPAGQSSHLSAVFTQQQVSFIKDEFFTGGGRGDFNCGSAFWVSKKRIYTEENHSSCKTSSLPLFEGLSEGPLCPHPGMKYQVGFFSEAVTVTDEKEACTVYLSGGGSFFLEQTGQKVRVLARYTETELQRLNHGKTWENAVILVSVGEGAALLSMLHPYYDAEDFEFCEEYFPDSGTDWRAVKEKLSSLDERMRFVLNSMLIPLEDMDLEETPVGL